MKQSSVTRVRLSSPETQGHTGANPAQGHKDNSEV